jgi:hypothetical protein
MAKEQSVIVAENIFNLVAESLLIAGTGTSEEDILSEMVKAVVVRCEMSGIGHRTLIARAAAEAEEEIIGIDEEE